MGQPATPASRRIVVRAAVVLDVVGLGHPRTEIVYKQPLVDLFEARLARGLGHGRDVVFIGSVGALDLDIGERIDRQSGRVGLDGTSVGGSKEVQPGRLQLGDGTAVAHRPIEHDQRTLQPRHLPDGTHKVVHHRPVLRLAADDFPAQRKTVLVDQQDNAKAPLVGHLRLGAGQLSQRRANALEVGVGDIHEQSTKLAATSEIRGHEALLEPLGYVEELRDNSVDSCVVEDRWLESQQLGQGSFGDPASGGQLRVRNATSLQDQREDGVAERQVNLGGSGEIVEDGAKSPPAPNVDENGEVKVAQIGKRGPR